MLILARQGATVGVAVPSSQGNPAMYRYSVTRAKQLCDSNKIIDFHSAHVNTDSVGDDYVAMKLALWPCQQE